MSVVDNREFKAALDHISAHAINLTNPFDRVRCAEWVRKLCSLSDAHVELSRVRNDYVQLLRIQVRHGVLHGLFKVAPPPAGVPLAPLAESLTNMIADKIAHLPRAGPIAPTVHHASPDGRAYVSVKQMSGGGVFCYMAVNPNGLDV